MILDEAIRHVNAEIVEAEITLQDGQFHPLIERLYADNKQMLEWLMELKAYRETYPYGVDRYNGRDEPQTDIVDELFKEPYHYDDFGVG